MSLPKPTEAAMKCGERISAAIALDDLGMPEIVRMIDETTDLPALTAVALAAQGVVDAGKPHTGRPAAYPDGCECDQCDAWKTLKSALEAVK